MTWHRKELHGDSILDEPTSQLAASRLWKSGENDAVTQLRSQERNCVFEPPASAPVGEDLERCRNEEREDASEVRNGKRDPSEIPAHRACKERAIFAS